MRAGGGTAMLDGLLEATRLLPPGSARRAIVLITDGYDENSLAQLDDVVKAVQAGPRKDLSSGSGAHACAPPTR